MFDLKKIVRPNILTLKPYSSARHEYKGKEAVFWTQMKIHLEY